MALSNLDIFLEVNGRRTESCEPGDMVDLVVKLVDGYHPGDLLWVCLPAALTSVQGGGQVKKFAVDFRGCHRLKIPLAVTSVTVCPDGSSGYQHILVMLRNMFEEERVGNPGGIPVMSGRF